MPFPWKKNKVTRISNFVSDLHSPKRGGSLVVETGFPTSLIDLFVKNRGRFKKPKLKKRAHREIPDPPPPRALPSPPPKPDPSNSNNRMVLCAGPRYSEVTSLKPLVGNGDDGVAGSDQNTNGFDENVGGSNSDPNKVIAATLKMLVVLVVTLSVKKLTFGITISAFVLLFLEFAGKHIVSCLKPCSNATMAFESFAQRFSSCNWFKNLVSVMGKRKRYEGLESSLLVREKIEIELNSGSSFVEEIEIVEPKGETEIGNRCEETCFAGSALNSSNAEKKWVHLEIEEQCEITPCKSKNKRSSKLKSKLVKKLVPKKLRGSKKEKRIKEREDIGNGGKEKEAESCSEVPSSVEEDKSASFEIEEEEQEGVEKQDNESKLECIEDDEIDCGITCSNLEAGEGESNVQEQEKIDRNGDSQSGCLTLFLITLAGLVLGHFPALILTVTWMFMLYILKSRGRSVNVPLIKGSEELS